MSEFAKLIGLLGLVALFLLHSSQRRQSKRRSSWRRKENSEQATFDQSIAYTKPAVSELEIRSHFDNLPSANVLHVIDGDTVIVKIGRQESVIRLDSIDCPEDGQTWGNVAKAGLIKLVGGCSVRLEEHGQDPYRRTLATIYVYNKSKQEWTNVNERMVMLGHAWVMRKFYDHLPPDRKHKMNKLEKWAKTKRVGLWNTPNPVPPWSWRNGDGSYPPVDCS